MASILFLSIEYSSLNSKADQINRIKKSVFIHELLQLHFDQTVQLKFAF